MDYSSLLALRDELEIKNVGDAFSKCNFHGPMALSEDWSIKFESRFGGFIAINTKNPNLWVPICPCRGCLEWSGGGHYCIHMIQFLREKQRIGQQKVTRNSDVASEDSETDAEILAEDLRCDPEMKMPMKTVEQKAGSSKTVQASRAWIDTTSPAVSRPQPRFSRERDQFPEFLDKDDDFKDSRSRKSSFSHPNEIVDVNLDESVFEEDLNEVDIDPFLQRDKQINKKDIEKLVREICRERNIDFFGLYVEGQHSKLIESIKKQKYKCKKRGVVVSPFGKGSCLKIRFKDGSSIYTCGAKACYFPAETLVGSSFFCENHKTPKARKNRDALNGKETLNAYKDAMKTYSKDDRDRGETKDNEFIGKSGWVRAMAKIYNAKKQDFKHTYNDIHIFLTVTRFGTIMYKNMNKDRIIFKCSWHDCYRTLDQNLSVMDAGCLKCLCQDHEDLQEEFMEMMKDFRSQIGKGN